MTNAAIPADVQQIICVDYRALRNSPTALALKARVLPDNIKEFETALLGALGRKQIDCLSMIGLCRMEKGDAAGAAQAFRRALKGDGLRPEAARALQYELAVAFQAAGDAQSALWYLNQVVRAEAGFRDAAQRLQKLGGGSGRAPPEPAPAGPPPPGGGDPRGGAKKNIGYV